MTDLNTYFQKHDLCAENILYIYRKDHKTVIQRTDGEEYSISSMILETSLTSKDMKSLLQSIPTPVLMNYQIEF